MTPETLRAIWGWLPAFRAVAETQHLPTAAARLHVSASALSRTVRLVEESVGEALFVRTGRRIVLNATGKQLLALVQGAEGILERGLRDLLAADFTGELRVSALGVLTDAFVVPALLAVAAEHPGCVPNLSSFRARDANRQLANATLDLAFYYDATASPGITCRRIGALRNGVYCGARHPLFRKANVSTGDVATHPFSVPGIGDRGHFMDNWPVDLERTVGFHITMLTSNLVVALSSQYLTVLPDVVAASHVATKNLRRLPLDVVPDTDVFVACREEDVARPVAVAMVEAVQTRLDAAGRPSRKRGRPSPKRSRG